MLCHRLQQVRSLWSEIPHIQKAVEKLSKECMDLLNKIFVVDDKKRITIEAIKEHPWYGPALCCPHQSTFPLPFRWRRQHRPWSALSNTAEQYTSLSHCTLTVHGVALLSAWCSAVVLCRYNKPLLPKYEAAETKVHQIQEAIAEKIGSRRINQVGCCCFQIPCQVQTRDSLLLCMQTAPGKIPSSLQA